MLAPDFRPCEFAPTGTLVCGGACGIKKKKIPHYLACELSFPRGEFGAWEPKDASTVPEDLAEA